MTWINRPILRQLFARYVFSFVSALATIREFPKKLFTVVFSIFFLTACGEPQTTIFINGDILTMNDAQPVAEAIAIRDGLIIAVGEEKTVHAAAGKNAAIRDIQGQTMIPGMIDAHGHFGMGAFISLMADLQPPPAGGVSNFDELTQTIKAWRAANPKAEWIAGMGYDDSLLSEGRHPVREDLDKISMDVPIMLFHVSGHLLTCNSACLRASGITADTIAPAGGVIRRQEGSQEPNGVIEETAMGLVMSKIPTPSPSEALKAIKNYQDVYASYGITTAQDGATNPEILKALEALAKLRQLKMDVVAYPHVKSIDDFQAVPSSAKDFKNHFRIGGVKLVLDGSPQGKTAWLTKPYHIAPEGLNADYKGYATMETEDVNAIFSGAYAAGTQLIAHANGDAAIDQHLMAAQTAREANGDGDYRTVIIHAQTARNDQIIQMKTEGVIPSFFVAHTYFWGDWHRDSVLGPQRASRISPLKTTGEMGVRFTIHNDAPVIPPDMMRLIWTAVNRETRSGQILGPDQRVSPAEALKAVTLDAAFQYFEEDRKGSLEVGKLADLTLLSDNPTKINSKEIKDIKILETLKGGKTIFEAAQSP